MKNFTAAIMLAIGACADWRHPETQPYTGGDLHSKDTFLYGRFVASMKSSQAKGTHTQFFLYDKPEGKEITNDLFDEGNSINYIPKRGHAAVITKVNREVGKDSHWMMHEDIIQPDDDQYHLYTIEWTPQYISYQIDEKELFRHDQVQSQNHRQNLWFTFLTYADKEGKYEQAHDIHVGDLPFWTQVEYVEVYNYDQQDGSFDLNFRDDFHSFDENRWGSLDNKSWAGMSSTFMADNASVEHGRLTLKVNRADAESDDDSDKDSSSDESDEVDDFHVLPPPKSGTLDQAIEKATRVTVTMVRTFLEDYSDNMGKYLMHH